MQKAGGIIALIAGIFGFIAAIIGLRIFENKELDKIQV